MSTEFARFRTILSLLLVVSLAAEAAVDVASRARGGSGTPADPWIGWDTAIFWQGENEFFFKSGYYLYSTSPNFLSSGIALRGEAGTVLQFNGSGNAVVFDNPGRNPDGSASSDFRNWTMNVRMENFIIQGNPNATNGLFLRGVRNGIFRNLSIRDVANAGVWTEALVTNIFENIRITPRDLPNDRFNVVPSYGIVLAGRGGDTTTTTTIRNTVIEGVSKVGIWVQLGSYAQAIINGTIEGNAGTGVVLDSSLNSIINTDFKSNGGADVEINNASNELRGVSSDRLIEVKVGQMNKLSGLFKDVRIANICVFTDLSGANISGMLTDSSLSTIKSDRQSGQESGLKQQQSAVDAH